MNPYFLVFSSGRRGHPNLKAHRRSREFTPALWLVLGLTFVALFLILLPKRWTVPVTGVHGGNFGRAGALGRDTARGLRPRGSGRRGGLPGKAQLVKSYGELPLSFEANQGQTDSRVKFLSRGPGYTMFLTGDEAVLTLRSGPSSVVRRQLPLIPDNGPRTTDVIRMKLVGASPQARAVGVDELPGKSNYFIGNDPKKWRTGVPNYGKVRYQDVYPGIDLVYYGNQRQLEYDWVVAPGVDPKAIRFGVETSDLKLETGKSKLENRNSKNANPESRTSNPGVARIDANGDDTSPLQIALNGDLVIATDGGEVRLRKPVVYQEQSSVVSHQLSVAADHGQRTTDNGLRTKDNRQSSIENRQFLDGRFTLRISNPKSKIQNAKYEVSFEVANYDRTKPLVIDPVLSYSTYLGGGRNDFGSAIAVDSSGNAYVTGFTRSPNFPTDGPLQANIGAGFCGFNGGPCSDAFVTKLNAAGTALVYSTFLGGGRPDLGFAIAVDSSGNAYVTGFTQSTNFPTVSPIQAALSGIADAFVTKLNAAGSALLFSTYLGGSDMDSGSGIAVDSSGNAFVTGQTSSMNFPTASPLQAAIGGGTCGGAPCPDAFVTKLNAAGSALVYSTYLGGSDNDGGSDIAVDSSGNAFVTGQTSSMNFPTASPFQAALGGGTCGISPNTTPCSDAFVTKLNAAGSALVYSTYLGGSDNDQGSRIAVDSSGNAYVTGQTSSTNFPTASPIQAALGGGTCGTSPNTFPCRDAFVTKLNAAGSALAYSTYLGGSSDDVGFGIAVDSSGNAYVTGQTSSMNFPTASPIQDALSGAVDAFVTKLNAAGSALVYSTYIGSSKASGAGSGVAVDSSGNALVAGGVASFDFPITPGAFQLASGGGFDAFVIKISPSDAPGFTLAPAILKFGDQPVGVPTAPRTDTVGDAGNVTLNITSVALAGTDSGDFTLQSNTCGNPVAGGTSCTVSVVFTPATTGAKSATLTFTDDAAGSPQEMMLTGNGVPAVSISPTALDFGSQIVGATSDPQGATLVNNGATALTISNIAVSGDFAVAAAGTTCSTSMPVPSGDGSCVIDVTFTPTAAGPRSGTLTVTDSDASSPHTVALTGSGTAPDFSLSSNPTSKTITAGQSAKFTLSVTPVGGFNQTVSFTSCTGAPSLSTCAFSPATVTPDGTNPATSTVTVTTTARTMLGPWSKPRLAPPPQLTGSREKLLWFLCFLALATVAGFEKVRLPGRGLRPQGLALALALLLGIVGMTASACGGGGESKTLSGTPAGTFSLTVTATSGGVSHDITLSLTVQ